MITIAALPPQEQKPAHPTFLTVKQFAQRHPWVSEAGLRAWIFNEQNNGFHRAVRRIGRRVLLIETAVFEWIEERNRSKASANPT